MDANKLTRWGFVGGLVLAGIMILIFWAAGIPIK